MAFSKRTIVREMTIRFDENGAFVTAFRIGQRQALEDGVIIADRELPIDFRTLTQIKADVAAL